MLTFKALLVGGKPCGKVGLWSKAGQVSTMQFAFQLAETCFNVSHYCVCSKIAHAWSQEAGNRSGAFSANQKVCKGKLSLVQTWQVRLFIAVSLNFLGF